MAGRPITPVPIGSNSSEFQDLLYCMICFETYRSPKMLTCGHTFCADCLQGYYTTYQQQKRAEPNKLPCPTCREFTKLPQPGGVSALRNDFKIQKIEEMFKTINIRNRLNVVQQPLCDSCRGQQKSVTSAATAFCRSCAKNYCQSCLNRHKKNPLFSSHKPVDKPTDSTADASPEFNCKVHPSERAKFLCRTCETVVCAVCILNEHDSHDVAELGNVFQENQNVMKDMDAVIAQKREFLSGQLKDIETLRKMNVISSQKAALAIKERTKRLVEALNAEETELLKQLRIQLELKTKQLAEETEKLNQKIRKATNLQSFAVSNTTSKNMVRLMAIQDELIQRVRTFADVEASVDDDVYTVVAFLPGNEVVSLGRIDLVHTNKEMVKIHLAHVPPTPPPKKFQKVTNHSNAGVSSNNSSSNIAPVVLSSNGAIGNENFLLHPPISHRKPVLVFNVDKLGSSQSELRDPLDVACLLNGDIVVSEWGNQRLQVFDVRGKSLRLIAAGRVEPQGVTATLRGNIMISDAKNKRCEVFSPTGSTLTKWGLGQFYAPCGVAVSPNGNLVVTDTAEHKVSIFRNERTCLKRFGSRGTRDDHFFNPLYVATGPHNEVIVSDSDNHCVKVFDSKGAYVRKFGSKGTEDGQLMFPRGVFVDLEGNVLVCDRNNNRVSVFSIQGKFLRHLLTKSDNVREPYGVYATVNRHVVITESGQSRASLKMFKL